MSKISVDVSSARIPVLQVGYQGENEVTDVLFDISSWITEFGEGVAQLRVKRPGNSEDESYVLSLTITDGIAVWTVSETDTFNKGNGKVQLSYLVGNIVKKAVIYPYKVGKSIVGADNPVDPFDSWIERSKAWAIGKTLDGNDVPETDETYQNNAKYYAEQADTLGSAQVVLATEQATLATAKATLATEKADAAAASEAAVNGVSTQLTTRMSAIETEQAVQDARMDTFTSLPEGSTSGNAELADIRVGADGTTYDTAGNAVRGQISGLKSDLANVGNYVGYTMLTKNDFSQGAYQGNQGIISSDYWIVSNLFLCEPNIKVIVNNADGYVSKVTFVNSTELATAKILKTYDVIEDTTITSPSTDCYLIVECRNENWGRITVADYISSIGIGNNDIEKLYSRMAEVENKANSVYVSPKNKRFINIVDDCQNDAIWRFENTNVENSIDTTEFLIGTQSFRSDKSMRCVNHTFNLIENNLVIKFKINAIDTNAKLTLNCYNTNDYSRYAKYELMRGDLTTNVGEWYEVEIPMYSHFEKSATNMDYSNVNDIGFYATNGNVDWNIQFIGLRKRTLNNGIISFTFDDGWKTQKDGIKALAEKGITGTIYHIVNAPTDEYLSLDELKDMVEYYGTDIEAHGTLMYTQMTDEELIAHWTETQSYMKENGLSKCRHLAYPNGKFPLRAVRLARSFFDTARTIDGWLPIESFPPADNYRMRALTGIGSNGYSIENTKKMIDRTVACGGWLILVFHKIDDGTTSMSCSVLDLQEVADYAIQSGANIMNIAEVYESSV